MLFSCVSWITLSRASSVYCSSLLLMLCSLQFFPDFWKTAHFLQCLYDLLPWSACDMSKPVDDGILVHIAWSDSSASSKSFSSSLYFSAELGLLKLLPVLSMPYSIDSHTRLVVSGVAVVPYSLLVRLLRYNSRPVLCW